MSSWLTIFLPRLASGGAVSSLALAVVLAIPVYGQTSTGNSTEGYDHPFILGHGQGDSSSPDTKVWDVRVPLSFNLIPLEETRRWGLNLRVTVTAGVYDFRTDEFLDLDFSFQSLAITPGVEFLVPAGEAWVLKPFAELGGARDFDNSLSVGVWSVGLRTLANWPVGSIDLTLGTGLQYLSTFSSDFELRDDFGELMVGLDASHPLPFEISGNQAELSLYAIRRQYVNAIVERSGEDPLEITASNEIGLAFDTDPKTRLWFFNLPRIGFGYRWGNNIRGWRLNFGWPF